MDKTKSITISQNDFHRIFIEETKELAGIDLIAPYLLARVGADVECALFGKLEEEENLKEEITRLQDPEYMAKYAREKYLYSKDNEIILKIEE